MKTYLLNFIGGKDLKDKTISFFLFLIDAEYQIDLEIANKNEFKFGNSSFGETQLFNIFNLNKENLKRLINECHLIRFIIKSKIPLSSSFEIPTLLNNDNKFNLTFFIDSFRVRGEIDELMLNFLNILKDNFKNEKASFREEENEIYSGEFNKLDWEELIKKIK